MKKLVLTVAAALVSLMAWAQTPHEILEKMSRAMDHDKAVGMAMTMDMKIPILGTYSTRTYTLGDKMRMEVTAKGKKGIVWEDGNITYSYDATKNTITITEFKAQGGGASSEDDDDGLGMALSVTKGYDVKLLRETDEYWEFRCNKRKDNTDKDAPKQIDLSVQKGSYFLREMKTSMKGVSVSMRDFSFDVTEEDVTLDISQYKDAKIVDKRVEEKKQQ